MSVADLERTALIADLRFALCLHYPPAVQSGKCSKPPARGARSPCCAESRHAQLLHGAAVKTPPVSPSRRVSHQIHYLCGIREHDLCLWVKQRCRGFFSSAREECRKQLDIAKFRRRRSRMLLASPQGSRGMTKFGFKIRT